MTTRYATITSGFSVRTLIVQPTPTIPAVRQLIIRTQNQIGPSDEEVTLLRKSKKSQRTQFDRLEPLGNGIAAGLLARAGVDQIKFRDNNAVVTLAKDSDLGEEQREAVRIITSQIAYYR